MKSKVRTKPAVTLRALRRADLPAAIALWKKTEGMALTASDSVPALSVFLRRNPGFSSAAFVGERLVGCVLCGHDARRGFLYHLAVAKPYRGRGIGRQVVERSLRKLDRIGVPRCNLLVLRDNKAGRDFWKRAGWILRDDVWTMQKRFGRD